MRIDKTDPLAPKLIADVSITVDLTDTRAKIAGARAQAAELRAHAARSEDWADAAQAELDSNEQTISEFEAMARAVRLPRGTPEPA